MNSLLKTYFTLFIFLLSSTVFGQQDLTMYYMHNIPQVTYANPSFRPMAKINVGLPGSSLFLHHYNTIITPKNLFDVSGDTPQLRLDHFQNQIKDRNYLALVSEFDLFSFGINVKKNYFNFHVTENVNFRYTMPGDFLRFPFTGNANFDVLKNGTLDFSGFAFDLDHYREYCFGFQRELTDKLDVGLTIKKLYGMENVSTKRSELKLVTDEDEFDWSLTGALQMNSSGVYPFVDSIEGNSVLEGADPMEYLFAKNNKGWGIDIGANYRLNDRLSLNASIVDLGRIKWSTNNRNLSSETESFVFDGLDMTSAVFVADSLRGDSINAIIDGFIQEVDTAFQLTQDTMSYTSATVGRFFLGGQFQLYDKYDHSGSIGAVIQGEFFKGKFRPSFTVSYNQRVRDYLNLNVSYSMINRDLGNIGVGMALNFWPVQFYVVTDNIMAGRLARISSADADGQEGFSMVYPFASKNMNVRLGLNFTIGRNVDRDKDGVVNRKDKCPDNAGLEKFHGCPDTDGDDVPDNKDACPHVKGFWVFEGCPDVDEDGVQDWDDHCPEVPGLVEFHGCPDTDGDGIEDAKDSCITVPGVPELKGCPEKKDRDKDGVDDAEDMCPDVAGPFEFKGCPDTDGDLIFDHLDKCPEIEGPFENRGCPWGDTDDDGVKDDKDKCPTEYGPASNDGCPTYDFDNDGVPDTKDRCPRVKGIKANNGCPEIKKEEQEVINTAFDNLEFISGKAIIKDESKASIKALADLLIKKPTWKLRIAGHTDDVGNDQANLELSKLRAEAVGRTLESYGVNFKRCIIEFYGESKAIADNKTEAGRQKNRRVEMEVVFE